MPGEPLPNDEHCSRSSTSTTLLRGSVSISEVIPPRHLLTWAQIPLTLCQRKSKWSDSLADRPDASSQMELHLVLNGIYWYSSSLISSRIKAQNF